MLFTEYMLRGPGVLSRNLTFLVLLIGCTVYHAYAQTGPGPEQAIGVDAKSRQKVDNLADILQSIESKRNTLRELREELKQLEDASEKKEIKQKIERIKNEITDLQSSFEYIVLGGVSLSVITEQPEQRVNWRDEIEQISRPLLSTLKELTAKPRQLDSLRRDIERREDQLKVIERLLESIRSFKKQALPPIADEPVNRLLIEWEQRLKDTERALELTRFKLNSLETESVAWQTSSWEAITEFFRGRGLTLLLATMVSLVIWLLFKGLLSAYWRWLYRTRYDVGITRAPLVLYSYRLATAIFIVLAILIVFYVRGDILLLTLAVIALAGAALSLRQTLPRYAAELRLLFGVGPVREEERLVLDGIPFIVESLGVYSVLRNPALEGVVRLPLRAMNERVSRPAGQEPWFPCQPGDYVLLANGSFGRVLRQTIEQVEVAVRDTVVQILSRDFLNQNVHNLSRDGFGIASTFGIDYRHQAICLDLVPGLLRKAIVARFEQAGLGGDIKDILVEFKAAGASSLDYQIYLILDGRAAKVFYKAQRLIQQACVETCHREGWVIPFTQITVHSSVEVEGPEQYKRQLMSDAAATITESSADTR